MTQRYDLIVEPAGDRTRTVPLPGAGTLTLGRHAEAAIVLADGQASRRHAELTCRDGRVWLRDLGSANGTLFGGQRIADTIELRPGDAFTIGDTTLRLALAAPNATIVPPAPPASAVFRQETAPLGATAPAEATARAATLPAGVGNVLNGRYRLDRLLGRGGFALVFLATDLTLRRQVAVKVLHAALTEDQGHDFLARFAQEARAVAALDHPNILSIHDYGEADGTIYLVMPYVEGGTLHDRLSVTTRVSPADAGRYLRQVAAALDYAHRRNLVHRDIKPQNMLIRAEDEHLLLADFGIAKAIGGTSAQSRTGVMGTLSYMAPEQFEGIVSPATDIYALGCVLFQLLTGQVPFDGSTEQVIFSHLQKPVPRLAERSVGGLPPAIQGVIERALAKRPDARYHTAGELSAAYDAALAGNRPAPDPQADTTRLAANSTIIAPAVASPMPNQGATVLVGRQTPPLGVAYPQGPLPLVQHTAPPPQRIAPQGNRRAFLAGAAGIGAVVLVAVAGGGALVLRSRSGGTPTATAPAPTSGIKTIGQGPSAQPSAPPSTAPTQASTAAPSLAPQPTAVAAVPSAPPSVAPTIAPPTVPPVAAPTTAPVPATVAPAQPTVAPAPSSAPVVAGFVGEAGIVLRGHSELIEAVAFSPDGRRLASASDDNTARLWQPSGQTLATLTGHTADVNGVAWSPDGSNLASASGDKTIRLWNASGGFVRSLAGHTDVVMATAWHPDNRTLSSVSWDGTVRVWNTATAAVRAIPAHNAKIWSIAVSTDGLIASGSADRTVKLWRADGTARGVLSGHTDTVWGVSWSPDGTLLASASADGMARIWNSAGQAVGTLLRGTPGVTSVAWSPNGKLIACGIYDGRVLVLTPAGQLVATCTGHTGYVAGVTWLPDSSLLASGAQDSTIRLWR